MFNGVIPFSRVISSGIPAQTLNSFGFDGTGSEYLDAANSANLNSVVSTFGWAYFTASQIESIGTIISVGTPAIQWSVRRSRSGSAIQININTLGGVITLSFPDTDLEDNWFSYCWTYDNIKATLYINGLPQREDYLTSSIDRTVIEPLRIGSDLTTTTFQGSSTTHLLFNTVPTAAEILDLHQLGKSVYISTLPPIIKNKLSSAYALSGLDATGQDLIGSDDLTLNGGVSADGQLQNFQSYLSMDYSFVPSTFVPISNNAWMEAPYDSSFDAKVGFFGRCYTPERLLEPGLEAMFAQFGVTGPDRSFTIYQDPSTGNFQVSITTTGTSHSITTSSPLNQWFSWAAIKDGTTLRLYIDGVEVNTSVVSALDLAPATGEPVQVGRYGFNNQDMWEGNACNFIIFNDIATPAEILTLHNSGDAFNVTDLDSSLKDKIISCWEFSSNNFLNDLIGSNDMTNEGTGAEEILALTNGEFIQFS